MNKLRSLAILAALVLCGAGQARADTWSGLITNDWFLSLNWYQFGGPPSSTESAIFPEDYDGPPVPRTDVSLNASTTVNYFQVNSPLNAQYTFTGANGAVLTATGLVDFQNVDLQALNVHTVSSLGLNTPRVQILNNAILSLNASTVTTDLVLFVNNGRVDVNNGSSVQTESYAFNDAAGELRVNSGGELRVATDTTLVRGTTTINSGGQLNALSGVDLEYNGSALLQFFTGHAVDNGVHLKATGGGDITSDSFIDVGNGNTSTLTVTGAGSTLTAGGSTTDWGAGASSNATVTIADAAVATIAQLRAGTDHAQFVGTVTSGATLRSTSSFTMGGGGTLRQVSLDVNGGTFEVDGSATFNNYADLNLVSGNVNFDGGATFNSGSRMDWTGGSVNLGANTTLLLDAAAVIKTSTSGFIFSGNTTTRIRNGAVFVTPSYFDLGNATLDMNNATLTVGTTGFPATDWGASALTTATLAANAVATYHSGLRMSTGGGTTNATISSGARLVPSFLSTGGDSTSNITLTVNGGRVESAGAISLFRGTTATVSGGGRMEAQDIVLGSAEGTASLTVSGAGSVLDANNILYAGRAGTTTLTVSGGANADALTRTVIGEIAGANSTLTVTGTGSTLHAGNSLKVGDGGLGRLNVTSGGYVAVFGGVTVNGSSKIDLDSNGLVEIAMSSSIANQGVVEATGNSQIRADILNSGTLRLFDSSATRSVTLLTDSQMFADNSSVGSLSQQAEAELLFELRGASNFDNLSVTGAASLGGDLVVSLAGGFEPGLNAQFQILSAASVTGQFAMEDFSFAPLSAGLMWNVLYGPTSVTLKVIAVPTAVPGDFDSDGDVDGADFVAWQTNFPKATGATLSQGDADSDGDVDGADFVVWQTNFPFSPGMGSVPVPEPAGWMLGLVAIGGLAIVRRRA
jgi:T5SS/PEP-CTERM-associated repeat protein